jgi:tRNA nucleotidyltransferase (CCA-adding enzyme)
VALREAILSACDLWLQSSELAQARPSVVVDRLDHVPAVSRYALYLATDDDGLRQQLQMYASHWQYVTPHITGHDLRRLAVPPGPVYRQILGRLRQAWLDGEVSSPEGEKALLEQLLRE